MPGLSGNWAESSLRGAEPGADHARQEIALNRR